MKPIKNAPICHCCKNKKATRTSYRSNSGVVGKYSVCENCHWLDNKTYWELYSQTNYPKKEN